MAKANGYSVGAEGGSGSGGRLSVQSKYTRTTELRRVDDNDIYRLASILDVNACWRKLMRIIPNMDAQACSADGALNYEEVAAKGGLKYNAYHINRIDDVACRLPPDQSISQVLIEEWKTSGQKNQRPTVGVLLQLLVQAELFSAADVVAVDFLNEPRPDRPADGPAADISLDLLADDLAEEMDIDNEGASFQPNTSALNAAAPAGGSVGMNLDYFDKHMVQRDKSVPQPILENGSSHPPAAAPIAPPRSSRSRQIKTDATAASGTTTTTTAPATPSTPNVPNLSILNASTSSALSEQPTPPQNIPQLSILHMGAVAEDSSTKAAAAVSAGPEEGSSGPAPSATSARNVPLITLLIENSSSMISESSSSTSTAKSTEPLSFHNLPQISALNLNAESIVSQQRSSENNEHVEDQNSRDSSTSSTSDSLSEEEEEEADESLPNLSNSEHQNSNNDSSLTTVTGTSGENSFELTNDSSSVSNDELITTTATTHNIPNLSELQ